MPTETFTEVMVTNALSPVRVVEAFQDLVPPTGTIGVMSSRQGSISLNTNYAPLADHWAAGGFVVVQPTHLDSKRFALAADDPRWPQLWRHRVNDMRRVLDEFGTLEAAVPGLGGAG
ncbi:hypothetical protein [Amycolatopsis dongchuanensis]|uniref:Uncharacterized protein n=1 Tax=Amycolatopsis dongchuanensis TaxID=1070866 RepID=A0ABP9QYF0_9PSEU